MKANQNYLLLTDQNCVEGTRIKIIPWGGSGIPSGDPFEVDVVETYFPKSGIFATAEISSGSAHDADPAPMKAYPNGSRAGSKYTCNRLGTFYRICP